MSDIMPRLTPIHYKKFEAFWVRVGCRFVRRGKGDHLVYKKEGLVRPIIFPAEKDLPIFIIRNNLRTLGISPEKYLEVLEQL